MTFEQVLLLYLYTHKKVSLNLFGTIELEGAIPDPEVVKKDRHLPVDGLKFVFQPQVTTDKEFVEFYATEKGRILSLSNSDIEMQLNMARQIVNIGNPFDIPGIGKIVKMDNGKLTINPGYYTLPPEPGSGRPTVIRERVSQAALPKNTEKSEVSSMVSRIKIGNILSIAGILAGVALLVWSFFTFLLPMFQNQDNNENDVTLPATAPVLVPQERVLSADTGLERGTEAVINTDSTAPQNWKAYISQTNQRNFAEERLKRYKGYGHNVQLEVPDSNTFLIYLPISSSIQDTAKKRDSLAKFFAFPVRLEKIQ